ncbi:cyclin-T2b isoform X2 [Triplophysa rosa]|uniref:cyclin-T2b isoform X2 n=1 Tax=Triplophysa rosa TaxID=992332 RepID=UPI00254625D2|nr:cyclin-T2b isoform X2 [Triplophysa rosa]
MQQESPQRSASQCDIMMMFSAVRAEAGGMMAAVQRVGSKWLFTREQFENTPSRRCGVEPDRELSYRQQAANLVQDMGQRLNVSQLTINTAIVYMHRFYMLNSFTKFHRNVISPTTLFLAAKVEEQPRKLEHVIKVVHACLNPNDPPLDTKSNAYLQQAQELVLLETIVLQTLGFEITIEHPHTDVVRCSQLVRASKDLAQTSYFMATNSLHLTTFCLQHKPTVVACVCIHLACKWSNWEIPVSSDEKHWWEYVDRTVTLQLLDDLTNEFLQILEKTPSKLKRIRNWRVPSLNQDSSLMASLCDLGAGVYSEPSTSFPLDTGLMTLNGLSTLQSSSFSFPAPIAQSTDAYLALQGAPVSKHGHGAAPLGPQKLTLEKYREKHAAELEQKRRHEDEGEPHRKHGHLSSDASSSRVKYSQVQERPSKSGSLKRRHPDSAENGLASQEELKMKIKVSSESSKGRHSPRSGREKHREHSLHKSRSDSSHGSHHHHHHHHHSSKTHRSSKSHSSSAPVNQALGHAHLTKIDRRPGEGQSSEGNAALINNGPHMDYEDTFNMLDSLLNAHNF